MAFYRNRILTGAAAGGFEKCYGQAVRSVKNATANAISGHSKFLISVMERKNMKN